MFDGVQVSLTQNSQVYAATVAYVHFFSTHISMFCEFVLFTNSWKFFVKFTNFVLGYSKIQLSTTNHRLVPICLKHFNCILSVSLFLSLSFSSPSFFVFCNDMILICAFVLLSRRSLRFVPLKCIHFQRRSSIWISFLNASLWILELQQFFFEKCAPVRSKCHQNTQIKLTRSNVITQWFPILQSVESGIIWPIMSMKKTRSILLPTSQFCMGTPRGLCLFGSFFSIQSQFVLDSHTFTVCVCVFTSTDLVSWIWEKIFHPLEGIGQIKRLLWQKLLSLLLLGIQSAISSLQPIWNAV